MEAPPYMPPQRKQTNVIVWVVVAVVCCCVLLIGGLVGGGFWAVGKVKGMVGCSASFQSVQRAILRYAGEHGGKLPNAAAWQDEVREDYRQSMLPKQQLGPFEQMQPDGQWGCTNGDAPPTGIAFNSDLSGKSLDSIKDRYNTVLVFETEHAGKNLHMKVTVPDFTASPLLMGNHRGWYRIGLDGPPKLLSQNGVEAPVDISQGRNGNSGN